MIEINIAKEQSKSGLNSDIDDIFSLSEEIIKLPFLTFSGIMTMGPVVENPEMLRPFFKKTHSIFLKLQNDNTIGKYFNTLSMGMSDSYKIAIEEGSNMDRIGSAIFGPRSYKNV
jgi:uncharacterized pyridoxal phosphate-containing UPF0001 family protein